MMRKMLLTLALLAGSTLAPGAIVEETVEYMDGGTKMIGLLVYDDAFAPDKIPGVLVVHQWMGLTEYERDRARQLAKLGYAAFAADIYGEGFNPSNSTEALEWANKFRGGDRENFRERLNLAYNVLAEHDAVDPERIAAIGYCFGGTGVLELARSGANVKAVVSFHGGLSTPEPADAQNIKGSVLVLHGAVDPYVPAEEVAGFQKEMEDAKVDYQLIAYGGAVHSFTEAAANSGGARYDQKADHRSWRAMRAFFLETLGR